MKVEKTPIYLVVPSRYVRIAPTSGKFPERKSLYLKSKVEWAREVHGREFFRRGLPVFS